MVRFFLIMIGLWALLPSPPLWGWECTSSNQLVVTSPRSGVRTWNDTIAVRGFLCQDFHLVIVRNRTTDDSVLTSTDELCEGGHCIYTFATFMGDLALGENELTAVIPDQDPPVEVHFKVLRTALTER